MGDTLDQKRKPSSQVQYEIKAVAHCLSGLHRRPQEQSVMLGKEGYRVCHIGKTENQRICLICTDYIYNYFVLFKLEYFGEFDAMHIVADRSANVLYSGSYPSSGISGLYLFFYLICDLKLSVNYFVLEVGEWGSAILKGRSYGASVTLGVKWGW